MKKITLLILCFSFISSYTLFGEAVSIINGKVIKGNHSVVVQDLGFIQYGTIDGKSFCETTLLTDLTLSLGSCLFILKTLNEYRNENPTNRNLSNWDLFKKYPLNNKLKFIVPSLILLYTCPKLAKNLINIFK